MNKILPIIFFVFFLPLAATSATWENWKKETTEISEGIKQTVKTFSSGRTETTYEIKVKVKGKDVWVDAIEINGTYEISDLGEQQVERASSTSGGSGGSRSGGSGSGSGSSGGGGGGGC